MKAFEDGEFVRHADYAALKAENEKYRRVFQGEAGWTLVEPNHLAALQAEVERLGKVVGKLCFEKDQLCELRQNAEAARLQAENERLRKAGDAMDAYLKRLDGTTNGMLDCRHQWLAAKGVQP